MLDYRCRRTDTPSATALLTLVEGRVTRAGTPPMYHILQLPIIGTFHWYIIGTFGTFGTFWYILVHFCVKGVQCCKNGYIFQKVCENFPDRR